MIHRGLSGITIGAISALIAQPVWAAPVEVTAVQLNPTLNGVEVIFDTQGNNRAQVFTVSRGNSSVADITNTQLRLPEGQPFRQDNPAPGITSVIVSQFNENTVQVIVSGTTKAPTGQVIRRDGPGLVLSFSQVPGSEEATTPEIANQAQPPSTGQRPNPTPAFLPRAVAPPVGDIAIAPTDVTPDAIDLGSSKPVSMTLRRAPVEEPLRLLARAAKLNLIYNPPEGKPAQPAQPPLTRTITQTRGNTTESVTASEEAKPAEPAEDVEITISLDIENESIQEAFNHILRVANLQANRVGQTIYVGRTLPGGAQNRIARTYRLNQIKATANVTTTQSFTSLAETGGSVSSRTGAGDGLQSSSGATAETAVKRETTTREELKEQGAKEILESYGANGGGAGSGAGSSSTVLQGLEVVADARANAVTLMGSPRVVEIATSLLRQMDLRRRQVAVSVKIVDVDLTKRRNANANFQFGSGVAIGETLAATFLNGIFTIGSPIGTDFLLNLFGSIQDQSAKILTSPTLMIQEGSSAQVNLTQEIFSGIRRVSTAVGNAGTLPVITEEPIIRPAGVILNVTLDRIDDNGFVTLNISPEVSAPNGTFEVGTLGGSTVTGTLLQQRRLETGRMRLRDGQTLVLTGIIQDEDRVGISKVPILGDIPLLGRLFRRDAKSRSRRELVVIVTPRILNDSDQSSFGYQYNPSPETEKRLNR